MKFLDRRMHASWWALLVALLLTSAYNVKFWGLFSDAVGGFSLASLPLLGGAFLILVLFFYAFLSLVSFRYVAKPAWIAMLLLAASASYFISTYGIVVDKAMVQNVFETDARESVELLNASLLLNIGLWGVLPALLIARARIVFPTGVRGLLQRFGGAAGALALAALLLVLLFKSLAPILRENRQLRFLLTPTNVIQATNGYLKNRWATPVEVAPLGRDAVRGSAWAGAQRKTLTVIVLGETARAANFSLNGYGRETNPLLSKQKGLINFPQVSSCGTSTAVSVPCVFSAYERSDYSDAKASAREGLLDVLAHAGFDVLWRNNNSGCKGVCDRVRFEDFSQPVANDPRCTSEECYDERMLDGLADMVRGSSQDMVVVLHQKGSHGPAYSKRYPAEFAKFGPVCTTTQFEKCSQESIAAAYDNTILYTDFFVSRTIDLLRDLAEKEGVDTSMLYFSDHGESLGENNVYLHGAPYLLAPREQTEVPMMLWMSEGFSQRFHIDRTCLAERSTQKLSHDNIFHSVLGMLDVHSSVLNPRLDIFHSCVRQS